MKKSKKSKKRKLNSVEALIAENLMNQQEMSIGQAARFLGVNKPSVKKALGLWKKRPKPWRSVEQL